MEHLTDQEKEALAYMEELVANKTIRMSSEAELHLYRKFHWLSRSSTYLLVMKLGKLMLRKRQEKEKIESLSGQKRKQPNMLTFEILRDAKADLEKRYAEYVPKLYNRAISKPRFEDLSIHPVKDDGTDNPIIAQASIRISEEMWWYGRRTFWFTYNIWRSGMVFPVEKETELTCPTGKNAYKQATEEWVDALFEANK